MRKLIVTNVMSLDGYYEGPGGNVMVLPMDQSFDAYNVERLWEADTLLLGRKSCEAFKGFWPAMADNPDATPAHREISGLEDAIDKVVIVSSGARMPTSRSPNSSAGPAGPSWSSAAVPSGTTCWPPAWSTSST